MSDPVANALEVWGMAGARADFVAGRENRVYRITADEGDFALRIRRPGYRTMSEIRSEVMWLQAMARAGLGVPLPRASASGRLVETVDGRTVDMIGWLPGVPMGTTGQPLTLSDPVDVFRALGAALARLHVACDQWAPPPEFVRVQWNAEGLLGAEPLWGRFWDNPTLDADTRALLMRFRDVARDELMRIEDGADYGLIHADAVRENVLLDGETIRLIDFDDGGYGFRLFDLATALIKNRREPDYPALEAALIAGYRSVREIDTSALPMFLALRAVTYVGWIVPRLGEDGGQARNARLVRDARALCETWLASR